jgi:CheY-like chemotaxis protein
MQNGSGRSSAGKTSKPSASGERIQKPAPPDRVAANKAITELFTRIQATVSLMLTTINSDHPHAAHLSQIERMARKGITLAKATRPLPTEARKEVVPKTDPRPKKAAGSLRPLKVRDGKKCVLLADGSDMFLGIGREMLQATGYKVLTARTGEETVRTYQKKKADIALIMLGMVTDPTAVYEELRRMSPRVPVLISDGYGLDEETRRALADKRNAFIEKPFSLQELSRKIRSLLDRQAGPN